MSADSSVSQLSARLCVSDHTVRDADDGALVGHAARHYLPVREADLSRPNDTQVIDC
jgi:hypothetical protein